MRMIHNRSRQAALVLSSGGARGYAHIGAIEELEQQGFHITSIAGTSMGALVGGMYATGQLPKISAWLKTLNRWQLFSLVDLTLSRTHLIKVEKVLDAMKQIVPDVRIEHLPIPYCAIAADIRNQEEIIFDYGSLYEAIRASISLPSFFEPVKKKNCILMDGGLVNPLPLNRVKRQDRDILVAINVNAPVCPQTEAIRQRAENIFEQEQSKGLQRYLPSIQGLEDNHFSLISKAFSMSIVQLTQLTLEQQKPDILVNIPVNRFETDYDQAERIIRYGRRVTHEAIISYQMMTHELRYRQK